MGKKRLQLMITLFLILVFVLSWVNTFKKLKKRPPLAKTKAPVVTQPDNRETQAKIPDKHLEWGRCPFTGKVYSGKDVVAIDLKLSGIIWDEKVPLAMINERVVSVGENVGSYNVVTIKEDRVIVNDGTKEFELRLGR